MGRKFARCLMTVKVNEAVIGKEERNSKKLKLHL